MNAPPIPSWQLYGETHAFPDVLHVERVVDRAAGLDWTIGAHRHLHLHQLFLLTSGRIEMTIDGTRQTIAPPAVVNIPRGTVHGFHFSAGTEGFVLTLPAHDFPELFEAQAEAWAPLSKAALMPAPEDIRRRFQTLSAVHAQHSAFRRTRLRGEALALAAEVAEAARDLQGESLRRDPRIARFQALVRAGLSQHQSLTTLAEALAMSPRTLSRLCKAETGVSVQAYVEAEQMREACRLLVYTRMTAQQIAYHLGFDDPSYFSRVFQRSQQVSPRAYRARFEG